MLAASPGPGGYVLFGRHGSFSGQQWPMITPDGSEVIATLGRGTALEVAEFSALTGKPPRALIPAVTNPGR